MSLRPPILNEGMVLVSDQHIAEPIGFARQSVGFVDPQLVHLFQIEPDAALGAIDLPVIHVLAPVAEL